MGLFKRKKNEKEDKIEEKKQANTFYVLGEQDLSFLFPSKDFFNNETIKPIINRIASDIAKVPFYHYRGNKKIEDSELSFLLTYRPNRHQSPFDFKYMLITQLLLNSNAFIYVDYDSKGNIIQLIPVDFNEAKIKKENNQVFIEFNTFGKTLYANFDDLIVLRRFYHKGVLGESVKNDLTETIDLILANKLSKRKAVKNNGRFKGYIKSATTLGVEELQQIKNEFIDSFISPNNPTGIGSLDTRHEYHEVKNDYTFSNEQQMTDLRNEVVLFYNVALSIVNGTASEQDRINYLEDVIEPILTQIKEEFTYKLFTIDEIHRKNHILTNSNKLIFATLQGKTNYFTFAMSTGVYSINELREIENLPPIEGGDIHRVDLNKVDITLANDYQAARAQLSNGKQEDEEADSKEIEISLRTSKFKQFDFDYAFSIKTTLELGAQFELWERVRLKTKAKENLATDEIEFLEFREKWLEENHNKSDFESIKKAVAIGGLLAIGQERMKERIKEEVARINGI